MRIDSRESIRESPVPLSHNATNSFTARFCEGGEAQNTPTSYRSLSRLLGLRDPLYGRRTEQAKASGSTSGPTSGPTSAPTRSPTKPPRQDPQGLISLFSVLQGLPRKLPQNVPRRRHGSAHESVVEVHLSCLGEVFLLTVGAFWLAVKLPCLQSLKALIRHTFPL